MSDFLSGLGGLIKGMQPLLGDEAKQDESMNAFLLKTEVSELQGKQNDVLARIGREIFDAHKQSGLYSEYADLFAQAEAIQTQIDAKQAQMEQAMRAAQAKQQAEELALQSRTCRACGTENEEGVKFCCECGQKLETPSAAGCPKCGAQNAPGTRFCGECGGKLETPASASCAKCGADNAPGTRFCGECGAAL